MCGEHAFEMKKCKPDYTSYRVSAEGGFRLAFTGESGDEPFGQFDVDLRIDINIAARCYSCFDVKHEVESDLVGVRTSLFGHPLQLPNIAVDVLVGELLDLDDQQILLLADSMDDQIGDDRVLADQLFIGQPIAQAFDHGLAPAPFEVDGPGRLSVGEELG